MEYLLSLHNLWLVYVKDVIVAYYSKVKKN